MERELKLTMAVPISTKLDASRKNEQNKAKRRQTRQRILLVWSAITFIVLGTFIFQVGRNRSPQAAMIDDVPSAGLLEINPKLDASKLQQPLEALEAAEMHEEAEENLDTTSVAMETAVPNQEESEAAEEDPTQPTQERLNAYIESVPTTYFAQSGDSIGVLAVRFGVRVDEILSRPQFEPDQLIPEGQVLFVHSRLGETTSNEKVFPDSEVVNSPSAVGFDIETFVNNAGGYLAQFSEQVYDLGVMNGAQIIEKVSREFSIHPKLLLALLEYESGWVYGNPNSPNAKAFPLGIRKIDKPGLFFQLEQAAGILGQGYYGWREGRTVVLTFRDGQTLRLAAELNPGSVALMQFFASQNTKADWEAKIYGENNLPALYDYMFGDPWRIAAIHEPLISSDVVQPELILPFEEGISWKLTNGPHAAWGAANVRAALDFAPPKLDAGCVDSYSWVTASSEGLVVRSEDGTVVVDMDGDGNEQTGWVIVYLHIATRNRIPLGTWVNAGDRIGHPSCEGGISTGTHLHITRKYNGEWVVADGPMPFVLSGWRAVWNPISTGGWLVKGNEIVRADVTGDESSEIQR